MTQAFVIEPPAPAQVPVVGGGAFPVRRIFCIGRNYADHVREMGGDPKSDPPVFFCKPADAVVPGGGPIPYATATENLHFEGELVVALKAGGRDLADAGAAADLIYGYACGCDLTRRDLQAAAKKGGGPWDTAKGFDASAPIGEITPSTALSSDSLAAARIRVTVNGEERQSASLSTMIWSIPEILQALSGLFELSAGDLIFTGTPEGVGALQRGDHVEVSVDSLPSLTFAVT